MADQNPGDAQAAGSEGIGIDAVAASIARKLAGESGDSEGEGNTPEAEEASTEAETVEGEEPETEEATDEGDEQDSTEPEKPQTYAVKVDGQDVQVTLEEALKGYSREADYTRKTMALSHEKATWEATREQTLKAERDALVSEREQAKNVLNAWAEHIQNQLGSKEYWDNLYQENPGKWAADQYKLNQQLQTIQKQADEYQQKSTAEKDAELNQLRQREYLKLVEVMPEWKDQAKLQEGFAKMGDYAVKVLGYDPQILPTIVDHKVWRALHDAASFHALKEKRPTIAPKLAAVKTVTPGPAQPANSSSTRLNKAAARVQKTGDTKDLAEMLKLKFAKRNG